MTRKDGQLGIIYISHLRISEVIGMTTIEAGLTSDAPTFWELEEARPEQKCEEKSCS